MPREAYNDRRRYDEESGSSTRDRYAEEKNRGYSKRRNDDYDERDRRRSNGRRSAERGDVVASSSRHAPDSRLRRRSRSPDFERDRARERQSYDRRHIAGSAGRGIGEEEGRSTRSNGDDQRERPAAIEPNFESSGLLAKESNNKNGVALKYAEPPEARKPKKKWRLYVFKDGKEVDVLHISRQSCYLMGRDRAVADIPIDHPSISKQHAVIQFRNIRERNEFGDEKSSIKPFIIDLESANGCLVNDTDVPQSRYYEMRNGDTLKLGGSQREYVLLAED